LFDPLSFPIPSSFLVLLVLKLSLYIVRLLLVEYYASLRSSGRVFFGCLFSKCCLYVFGSGIWALQTVQRIVRAFAAAAFWSCKLWPCCFFILLCFSWAFAWDCNFCWPRAILPKSSLSAVPLNTLNQNRQFRRRRKEISKFNPRQEIHKFCVVFLLKTE